MDHPYFADVYEAYDWLTLNDFKWASKNGDTEYYETKTHRAELWSHERDSGCFTLSVEEKKQIDFDF